MITANPSGKRSRTCRRAAKIAAESPVGNTLIWTALIDQMDKRKLAEGGDDLELVSADYRVIPDLVLNNEVCAAPSPTPPGRFPSSPRAQLNIMYDGRSASELYGEIMSPAHPGAS